MKILAILKDSLRETLDVKLFYVLAGISVLAILFVASTTYRPEPMEPQVKPLLGFVTFAIINDFQSKAETRGVFARPEVSDFEQLDPAREPWESDHRFTLTFDLRTERGNDNPFFHPKPAQEQPEGRVRTEKDKQAVEAAKAKLAPDYVRRVLKDGLFFVKEVEVAPAAAAAGEDKAAFEVTLKGTTFKSRKEWFHKPRLFFGALEVPVPLMTLAAITQFVGDWIIGGFGTSVIMFLSIIMTASFLPTMLGKGTIDLLLAKPISRTALLLDKFLGGLLFMILNTAFIMVGIWLALGFQTGLWTHALLLCVPIYTFQFAIFYSVSALIAVLTRSAIVAILGTVVLWVLLFALGWTHWVFIERGRDAKPQETTQHWAYVGYDAAHTVLPRYKDIDWLTTRAIKEDLIRQTLSDEADREKAIKDLDKEYGAYSWRGSLIASGTFIALMVGLACLRFATKDY